LPSPTVFIPSSCHLVKFFCDFPTILWIFICLLPFSDVLLRCSYHLMVFICLLPFSGVILLFTRHFLWSFYSFSRHLVFFCDFPAVSWSFYSFSCHVVELFCDFPATLQSWYFFLLLYCRVHLQLSWYLVEFLFNPSAVLLRPAMSGSYISIPCHLTIFYNCLPSRGIFNRSSTI
jgi:hypothetical protein